MLRAIPTYYDGHHFRSRLEARWALFFNFIGIPWEFEPQGFAVGDAGFLPDFWLPSLRTWFEAKPDLGAIPDDEIRALIAKIDGFVGASDQSIVVAFGSLRDGNRAEITNSVATGRDVEWGRCGTCLAWDLGGVGAEHRPCGHAVEMIGQKQATGALHDAHAHSFWEPA